MSNKREVRLNRDHEMRAAEGEGRKIRGYAAVFNAGTNLSDYVIEKIAPGAFARSIAENDIKALWSHNMDLVIGRNKNGSLKLREDEHGLAFDLDLPDTTWGRDAYTMIRDQLVTGVSIGFVVRSAKWEKGEGDNRAVRMLLDVDLLEISPTAFPAYEQTHVSARSIEEVYREQRDAWEREQRNDPTGLSLMRARFQLTEFE